MNVQPRSNPRRMRFRAAVRRVLIASLGDRDVLGGGDEMLIDAGVERRPARAVV